MQKPQQQFYPSMDLEAFLKDKATVAKLTKDKFEIVITHYNEPIDWIEGIEHLCTVYQKGDQEPAIKPSTLIRVPNHGNDLETVIRHCIERYDTLADVTFFAQAKILDRVDQPLYPLLYYAQTQKGEVRAHTDTLDDLPTLRFQGSRPQHMLCPVGAFGDFRKKIGAPYRPGNELWVKGNWMAVGKDRIRAIPLSTFQGLRTVCAFERGIGMVEESYYMERTYYSLFTGKIVPTFPTTLQVPPQSEHHTKNSQKLVEMNFPLIAYYIGILIIFATHIYMLTLSQAMSYKEMRGHALLNLGAGAAIAYHFVSTTTRYM